MTTPEDQILWESDEEALYRAARALPATLRPSGADPAPVDVGTAEGAREARYAEAWNNAEARWCEGDTHSADAELGRDEYCGRAVMAVADAEQAELRAESRGQRDALSVAEDTLRALREGVRALADEMGGYRTLNRSWPWIDELRALLAPSPAAAGAADHDPHARLAPELVVLLDDWDANDEDDNYSKGDAANDLRAALTRACGCERGLLPHDRRCPTRLDRMPRPAPVSSGEAGTGEWFAPLIDPTTTDALREMHEHRHVRSINLTQPEFVPQPDPTACPTCGANNGEHGLVNGELCPTRPRWEAMVRLSAAGMVASAAESERKLREALAERASPGPVVTPSAEGRET